MPKLAEGKPDSPLRQAGSGDEERAAEPVGETSDDPPPVGAGVAETKYKIPKQKKSTQRQDLQKACADAKEETKRLKSVLVSWNKTFYNQNGRQPTTEDKKTSPEMQIIFHDYFESSNLYKDLVQQLAGDHSS